MDRGLIFALLVISASAARLPIRNEGAKDAVPNQFIVVFKPRTPLLIRNAHIARVKATGVETEPVVWDIYNGSFTGYSVRPTVKALEHIRNSAEVKYIEQDQVVRAVQSTCNQQADVPSWGLDRVSEVNLFIDGNYHYPSSAGEGINVYVIDTGIYVEHNDFKGRAVWGANFAGDGKNTDCNGHGTHVAGTAAGTLYGIAKKANLIAVKVLNCGGSGTWTGVVSGIQYVAQQHSSGTKSSVSNMSLGGGYSQAVNDATAASVAAGVVSVVAAGNEDQDACNVSPASCYEAITVGATTIGMSTNEKDVRSYYSNFGACTDIFAPGSDITSAWIGNPNAHNTISGTSMASPHVAGVVANILGDNPGYSPKQVAGALRATGTAGIVDLDCGGDKQCEASPNMLLHHACDSI